MCKPLSKIFIGDYNIEWSWSLQGLLRAFSQIPPPGSGPDFPFSASSERWGERCLLWHALLKRWLSALADGWWIVNSSRVQFCRACCSSEGSLNCQHLTVIAGYECNVNLRSPWTALASHIADEIHLDSCISRKPLNPIQTFIIMQCFGKIILLVQRCLLRKS